MEDKQVFYENKTITEDNGIQIINEPIKRILLFNHTTKPTHMLQINVKLIQFYVNNSLYKRIALHDTIFYYKEHDMLEFTTAIRNIHMKIYKPQGFVSTSGMLYVFYYQDRTPTAYFCGEKFERIEHNIWPSDLKKACDPKYKILNNEIEIDDSLFR